MKRLLNDLFSLLFGEKEYSNQELIIGGSVLLLILVALALFPLI